MLKVGHGRLWRAMHVPAMTTLQFNPTVQAFGNRLKEREEEKLFTIGAAMWNAPHIRTGASKSRIRSTGRVTGNLTFDNTASLTPRLPPQ